MAKKKETAKAQPEVLGATFEPGVPSNEECVSWRGKIKDRKQMLNYLQTGERYWYSKEGYGSEKRKKPA